MTFIVNLTPPLSSPIFSTFPVLIAHITKTLRTIYSGHRTITTIPLGHFTLISPHFVHSHNIDIVAKDPL
jgi:hypothetical protein